MQITTFSRAGKFSTGLCNGEALDTIMLLAWNELMYEELSVFLSISINRSRQVN